MCVYTNTINISNLDNKSLIKRDEILFIVWAKGICIHM